MNKSQEIRRLAAEGLSVSQIAVRMGVRYQFAYNVLKAQGQPPVANGRQAVSALAAPPKPPLNVEILLGAGFVSVSKWMLNDDGLLITTDVLPKDAGVYAFAKADIVQYVGVATMGLSKRLYFYSKPGVSQRTSLRLNEKLKNELALTPHIDILIATPEDLEWNGLPVHGAAGLELGLIKKYALPWNMRSAG